MLNLFVYHNLKTFQFHVTVCLIEVYIHVSILCDMLKPQLRKPFISLQELTEHSSLELQQLLRQGFRARCKPVIYCSCGMLCDMMEEMISLKKIL